VNGNLLKRLHALRAVPHNASQLYSRNVMNLFRHLLKEGRLEIDFQNEITSGCCLTYQGEILHERARELIRAAS
jgi:H+-translocating NAD(P) transhydrogenase subunit alpha